jgi:outer membrane immunogenic protein
MKYMIAALAVLSSTTAFAQESDAGESQKIGGLRAELNVGIERPNLNERDGNTTYVAKLSSSFSYGGEIGYDIPVSDTVTVGPYVAYNLASSDICENGSVAPNQNLEICFKAKSNLSAGLRGGFATGKMGELYLSVGYDKYDYDYSEVLRALPSNTIIGRYSNDSGDGGIGIGMGYNHMLGKNVYAGLGMRISEMGDFEDSGWSLQRFQGHATIGVRF